MQKNNYLFMLLISCALPVIATTTESTGANAVQKLSLFEQAATLEQSFKVALAQCQKNNNCQTCPIFRASTTDVARHLVAINKQLNKLEQGTDGVCNISERDNINDLQNRFIALLQSQEAHDAIIESIKKDLAQLT